MSMEDIIKNLTPEQLEKVREGQSKADLIKLASDEGIELDSETLDAIAGGADGDSGENCSKRKCPKCGSTDLKWAITPPDIGCLGLIHCNNCGYEWWAQ